MAETVKIQIETTGGDNIADNLNNGAEAAKSLKAQLREATLELQNLSDQPGIDPAKIEAAAKKVGELKDAIGDANDLAKNFEGNRFENMSASLGGVKDAIMNLDFSKANDMAKNFAANAKGISFKGAISSVKDLGSTFMTLGKALLTNPLFLIGTVIALLVVAIVKVLDKLGVLKKIADAVGKAFDFLMGILEGVVTAITDLLGVTSEAEREATAALERSAAAAEKNATKTKNANEEAIQGIDHKIKRMELEGKSTTQLERQKVQLLRETARANYEAAQQAYQLALRKGDMDAKEIADLKEKARVSRLAYSDAKENVKDFEAKVVAEKKKAEEEKAKIDKAAAKTAADNAASAYKDRLAKQKEYEKQRLETSRQIEDLRAELIKEGYEKELKLNDVKYNRLIEDTKKNEKLLQSEKDALIRSYEKLREQNANKILDEEDKRVKEIAQKKKDDAAKAMADAIAAEDEFWNKEKAGMDLRASYIKDDQQRAIAERQNAYQQELVDLQKALDDKTITEEEYANLTIAAEQKKADDIDKINKEAADKEKARQKEKNDAIIGGVSNTLSMISSLSELFAGKSKKQQEKAFKVQKGVQIAQATIDTFKAATGAYSSMASIPVVGPALGAIAAAAAVAAGLANIKKISATQFKPEGGEGETPSAPGGGGGGGAEPNMPSSAPTPPSLTINGGAMSGGEGGGLQLYGSRQTPVRSYVVESDITGTQNRLHTYQQRAEIG